MSIVVLGYYNHHNLGDDLFEILFQHIARRLGLGLHIFNPETISALPDDTKLLICGGGDIMNDYFLNKVEEIAIHFTKPIYAVSVGFQYPSIITNSDRLDLFDHFYVRNHHDANLLMEKYGSDAVTHIHDLVFYIPFITQNLHIYRYPKRIQNVGVCIARSIYVNNPMYPMIIQKLARVLDHIHSPKRLFLLPFNTSKTNPNESDLQINMDLYAQLAHTDNVTIAQTAKELLPKMDLVICSRYHAHILAISHGIPIISLTHTRKAELLMQELNLSKYMVRYTLNSQNIPLDIDENAILNIYHNLDDYNDKLQNINDEIATQTPNILNLMYDIKHPYSRPKPMRYLNVVAENVINLLGVPQNEKQKLLTVTGYLSQFDPHFKRNLVKLISYTITKCVNSKYNYGLNTKLWLPTFNFSEEIGWILQDYAPSQPRENVNYSSRFFNIDVGIDHSMKGYHRSGWNYVTNILHQNFGSQRTQKRILDTFLDATFNDHSEILTYLGILPYHKKWFGFIHHTPNTDYSQNNVVTLIQNPLFQQSLTCCKGLIVLSKYLQKWLEAHLTVPIYYVCHPTEIPNVVFSFTRFMNNIERQIIQIGGWMRNSYGIYRLNTPKYIQKSALKGRDMHNYFKPSGFDLETHVSWIEHLYLYHSAAQYHGDNPREGHCCDTHSQNKYILGLVEYLKTWSYDQIFDQNPLRFTDFILSKITKNDASVNIIEHISDDDYDILLSENIVFLDMVDASAINTLIECIVRNTPILINPIPSVVELLGLEYPLYYSSYNEAKVKVGDFSLIKNAHRYIKHIDKSPFTQSSFMDSMKIILNL